MKRIVLEVPGMYADHHVLRIRQAVLGIQGVNEVKASAAQRKVAVSFDEQAASADTIRQAIVSAGYALDGAPATTQFPQRHKDGSPWYSILDRKTTTERKDREMAGDFRRY